MHWPYKSPKDSVKTKLPVKRGREEAQGSEYLRGC